jgi:hypothetical protein
MNTNSLPYHAMGSGIVNALETKSPRSLKVSLDGIYEMLVKTRHKKGSYQNRSMNRSFSKYHKKRSND